MEKIIEVYNSVRHTFVDNDPETKKNFMISLIMKNIKTVSQYFTLLQQVCEYCSYPSEPSDLYNFIEDARIDNIVFAIRYVRSNKTNYSDIDILYLVLRIRTLATIDNIITHYFSDICLSKETWLSVAKGNIEALAGLIVTGLIDFDDVDDDKKARIKKYTKLYKGKLE